jgi:hypothetical protein
MGRFTSPDWATKPEAAPYSSFGNPQSLNLYSYVGNNPLSRADADGHFWREIWNAIATGCACWTRDRSTAELRAHSNYMAMEAKNGGSINNPRSHYKVSVAIVFPIGPLGELGDAAGAAAEGATEAEGASTAAETGDAVATSSESTTLQSGGNSITNQTAKGLNEGTGENLTKREWGRALEDLKKNNGLSNDTHGKIMSNADYSVDGKVVGNITHYIP